MPTGWLVSRRFGMPFCLVLLKGFKLSSSKNRSLNHLVVILENNPESVGSDSLITGKAQTNASLYPYNFYIYGITYFWLDPKVPKTQCLPARGRPACRRQGCRIMDAPRFHSLPIFKGLCSFVQC